MPKKGRIEEIINRAKYFEGIEHYTIIYRDLENYIEVSLEEWFQLSELNSIPLHRIQKIKHFDQVIFERSEA